MKKTFLFFFLLFFSLQAFAVSSTANSCLAPKDLLQVGDCLIKTILFGYDVAIIVFLVCLLFIMAKAKAPLSLAAPTFLVFVSIFIGANVLSNFTTLSALFYYFLIFLGVLLSIGLVKIYSR